MLKNSKFQDVFPLTIFQGKVKIFKFFLVLKFSRQKYFENFFNFKIPCKIPKINFSKFDNLSLKNSKFQGVFPPITIFQGKMKIFKYFYFKMFPPKNVSKIIFINYKTPGKIPKINFSQFENLMLKNSKFQGVFPLKIFQGTMEIFNFFLVLIFSRQKFFENFFISKFP
jgi:hypothetical protein